MAKRLGNLRALGHICFTVLLTLASLFFTWMWYVSGRSCIPTPLGVQGCSFNPSDANKSFVSATALCAFLVGTEFTIARKSISNRSLAESPSQYKYRKRGIRFITIGAALSFIGFYLFNTTMVSCPVDGCSSAEMLAVYGPLLALLYVGMVLIAIGEAFILKKFMAAPTESSSTRTRTSI
jgi:hypothetical protein